MLKFKNILNEILKEDREEEEFKIGHVWNKKLPEYYKKSLERSIRKADNLKDELNSGKWLLPDSPGKVLYRGTSQKKYDWNVEKIRRNREPKDTEDWLDQLLENVRERYFPEIPSRRSSKFAMSGKLETVEVKYGEPSVVFPLKDSNISSLKYDAINYTHSIESYVTNLSYNFQGIDAYEDSHEYKSIMVYINENYSDLWTVIGEMAEVGSRGGEFVDIDWMEPPLEMKKKSEDIIQKIEDEMLESDNYRYHKLYDKLGEVFESAADIFEEVGLYFLDMKEGVHSNQEEVIFSGEKYIRVDFQFWKFFIEYNFENQNVKLNKHIRQKASEDFRQLDLGI